MKIQGDLGLPSSDSVGIGGKRISSELGDNQESTRKRTKMKHRPPETSAHHFKTQTACDQFQSSEEIPLMTNLPISLDLSTSQAERSGKTVLPVEFNPIHKFLDLNSEACIVNISPSSGSPKCTESRNKVPLHDTGVDGKCVTSGAIGLDLNEEDVTSSVNQDSLHTSEGLDHSKSKRDLSECGSTTGPVEEKDPLKLWKEMKQNGFLSSSHGGISFQSSLVSSSHGGIPMPKQRGRKSKTDLKKRMEIAKKEQVDKFTKIAAPSGLLNGLNPGIINHVRNKKQVHSIIEALVRSEKVRNSHLQTKQAKCVKTEAKEISNIIGSGKHHSSFSQDNVASAILCGSKQIGGCRISSGVGDLSTVDKTSGTNSVAHSTAVVDGDTLALKLSASTKASEESSTFSNEDSTNGTNISSLSVRAASVASQWLELLHQDIKGRLSALRRSKKRVRAVIATELPFLLTKEFPSDQENDPYIMKNSCERVSSNTVSTMHKTRWTTLFDQMDQALSEEEKQLESWLNQVKEMQVHCDQGLQNFQLNAIFGFQQHETSESYARIGKADHAERELAVRAAAASIYSTCSLLMSKENVSCF